MILGPDFKNFPYLKSTENKMNALIILSGIVFVCSRPGISFEGSPAIRTDLILDLCSSKNDEAGV